MHARLDEDVRRTREVLETARHAKEAVQEYGKPGDLMPGWYAWDDVIAVCEQSLRYAQAVRGVVRQDQEPDTSQSPSYYAALGLDLLEVAASFSDHPDYGRLFG